MCGNSRSIAADKSLRASSEDEIKPHEAKSSAFRVVLGIDAAWTRDHASGVALVEENSNGWRLIRVASCFYKFREPNPSSKCEAVGSSCCEPAAEQLLAASERFCGRRPNLIAVDMPLSRQPINGRRVSDDKVSKSYGAKKCATHSPSARRPGKVGLDLQTGFESAGYPLRTCSAETGGLIEVYPHPALVNLCGAQERLRYKAAKVRAYWPKLSRDQRRGELFEVWRQIVDGLEREIEGVEDALPEPRHDANGSELKAFEDQLDAIVCAWVGICALERRADPHGDETSAIWIPQPPFLEGSHPPKFGP